MVSFVQQESANSRKKQNHHKEHEQEIIEDYKSALEEFKKKHEVRKYTKNSITTYLPR